MSRQWTDEQKQAIDLRDRNLLVSAAAGSGKTAVLVERILSRVTDPERPVDIDRLLVVTFTRAAAAEMRDRIGRGLEERLAADPDNEHLQRQSILLHHAQISTIHSFCTYVIQNYYHRIELDPNYRIASEGELLLLRQEVLDAVLEEEYERAEKEEGSAFSDLVESLSPGRSDAQIGKYILQIAKYAESDPEPQAWLAKGVELVSVETEEELEASVCAREIIGETHRRIAGARRTAEKNKELAQGQGGPQHYLPALDADIALFDALLSCDSLHGLSEALAGLKFVGLSSKKSEGEDPLLRKAIQDERNHYKDSVSKLQKSLFSQTPKEMLEQMRLARPLTEELARLSARFLARFSEEKSERGLMDFSDLEHNALRILLEKDGDAWVRTDAARELSEQYEEILIDEYQDSNLLQEVILEAVSREKKGAPNRFMVGDIKQSIYGFRMARPELFLEKYNRYQGGDATECRIDLGKNFRSRAEVLNITNAVFEKLMTGELGGIVYDEAAKLHLGAEYPEPQPKNFAEAELLLIEDPSYEFLTEDTKAAIEQTEALAVASRIRALVESGQVYDRDAEAYRPIQYRDCVILLRSMSDTYVRILQEAGVPAYAESKEGYFTAPEVATVMDLLRICDNPRQDIPLATVLRSPIVGLSDEELARLRCANPKAPLFDAVQSGAKDNKKIAAFMDQLETFRELSTAVPVHELIQRVIEETGYGLVAAAMPAGEQREANLKMLVEKAIEFEKTSYHGLFGFIRYIEDLKKYKAESGEVNLFGEGENAVRVMSIHKSKGLEFPVVFLASLGHGFNKSDSRGPVTMHARLGLAVDAVDLEHRIRRTPLSKKMLEQAVDQDYLAEELRVLYVAMTRATEKLILTGAVKDADKALAAADRGVDIEKILSAKTVLDWILPAIAGSAPIRVERVDPMELTLANHQARMRRSSVRQMVSDRSLRGDEVTRAILAKQADFRYPYAYLSGMPAKMSVSELKRAALAEYAEEAGMELFEEKPVVPYLPKFIKKEEKPGMAAARGTIYHRVFECLDFVGDVSEAGIQAQLVGFVRDGKMAQEELEMVQISDVLAFLQSPLGTRMCAAAKDGTLRREQPFVFLVPASEVRSDFPAEEEILVQGIIDAFFEEDEKIILVDYKTDRVQDPDGSDLIAKYAIQLSLYRRALEQITEKKVAETLIYSMALGREIRVEHAG